MISGAPSSKQPFQAVVAVDDAAVQVIQVGRCKTAAVELNHRAEIRRNDRNTVQNHPLRAVAGKAERFDDFQALENADALLAAGRFEVRLELLRQLVKVDLGEKLLDRFRAHVGLESHLHIFRACRGILFR